MRHELLMLPLLAALPGVAGSLMAQVWTRATYPLAPSVTGAASMTYDPARDRVVLFGGHVSEFVNSDQTWEHDGTSWQQIAVLRTPPAARANHCATYDVWRRRVVIFGGVSFTAPSLFQNDTWEYDGATWQQVVTPTQPPPRFDARMAYDVQRRRVVLFGGFAGGVTFADTWELDGADWRQRAPATIPAARSRHGMAYDSGRNVTMMWGGAISGTTISADLWEWDGNDWSLVAATNAPAGRNAYSIAFDDARGRLVMFNGALFSAGETWEYEPRTATWSNVNAPPPPGVGTLYASSTFDARAGQIVAHVETGVFGPTAPGAMIRYTPGPSPTFAHYGTGCAASSGTPVLTAATGAVPALGTTLPLQIAPLPATPGLVVFAFGFDFLSFQGRPLPVGLSFLGTGSGATPLCNLWIALADFVAVPHAGATAAYGLTIPAAPRLAGLRAAAQGLVFDAFAANGVGAVTNAAILRVF